MCASTRKRRQADPPRGKGKRGGLRVIKTLSVANDCLPDGQIITKHVGFCRYMSEAMSGHLNLRARQFDINHNLASRMFLPDAKNIHCLVQSMAAVFTLFLFTASRPQCLCD
jgi:hypothetical protein